jgi:rubrerythrin
LTEPFASRIEQAAHFQSDLHIVNLKRRLAEKLPMTQEQWEECRDELLKDLSSDEDGDDDEDDGIDEDEDDAFRVHESASSSSTRSGGGNSSASACVYDADDGEELQRVNAMVNAVDLEGVRHSTTKTNGPQLVFRLGGTDRELAVSRTLFPILAEQWSPWRTLHDTLRAESAATKWFVLLMQSGKVAAAIFQGPRCMVHKCFRRYTIRAKSGGSQAASDSSGSKAQSAGSQMRRQGEQKLKADLWHLLHAWVDELRTCHCLLASVPKSMRPILFAPESPVDKADGRLRWVPFAVQKPTLEEIMRVHMIASTSYVREAATEAMQQHGVPLNAIAEEGEGLSEAVKVKASEVVLDAEVEWDEADDRLSGMGASLAQICLRVEPSEEGGVAAGEALSALLQSLCGDDGLDACDIRHLVNRGIGQDGETLLHMAARVGNHTCLLGLLQSGADPTQRTLKNRTAYSLAKDKATREAFRRVRGVLGEASADWDKAGVPPAVDDDVDEQKRQKDREKKKRAKQRKKETNERAQASVAAAALVKQEEEERRAALRAERERDPAYQCRMCHVYVYRLSTDSQPVCSDPACAKAYRRHLMASAAEARLAGK